MNKQIGEHISKLAETLAGIQERAAIEYTPLVNDICNRKATKDEVDNLLTWMFVSWEMRKCLCFSRKYVVPIYTHIRRWLLLHYGVP